MRCTSRDTPRLSHSQLSQHLQAEPKGKADGDLAQLYEAGGDIPILQMVKPGLRGVRSLSWRSTSSECWGADSNPGLL